MNFTDKRVLVTGSSRGIGFDIAKTFLDAGARVAINGSTEESAAARNERWRETRLGSSDRKPTGMCCKDT